MHLFPEPERKRPIDSPQPEWARTPIRRPPTSGYGSIGSSLGESETTKIPPIGSNPAFNGSLTLINFRQPLQGVCPNAEKAVPVSGNRPQCWTRQLYLGVMPISSLAR